MKSRKGVNEIGWIMLFSMIILVSIVNFMLMVSTGNTYETQVSKTVNYETAEVKKRSVITTTMNDYVWRMNEENDFERGKYNNRMAIDMISLYFSEGNSVYLGTKRYTDDEIKQDLENYLDYKMRKFWKTGSVDVEYWLEIIHGNQKIEVVSEDYNVNEQEALFTYPVALTNGELAKIVLRTKTSTSVYGVNQN